MRRTVAITFGAIALVLFSTVLLYSSHTTRTGSILKATSAFRRGEEEPEVEEIVTPPEFPSFCKVTAERVNYATRAPRNYSVFPPAQQDRISIRRFKDMAEVCFATMHAPHPYDFNTVRLTPELMPCLHEGVVIHVDGKSAKIFVDEVLPVIPVSFILISNDLDDPPQFDSFWQVLEDHPKCLGWFVSNSDLPLDKHPSKHHPIPLGLNQWPDDIPQARVLANLTAKYNIRYTAAGQPLKKIPSDYTQGLKSPSIGLDFFLREGPRSRAWARFCDNVENEAPEMIGHAKCNNSQGVFARNLDEHYKKMSAVDFAISPIGAGMDCYRTWEMLFLGVYPIVERNTLATAYEGLPVMIVDNWNEISLEKLNAFKQEADSTHYEGYRKMHVEYWEEQIWKLRPKSTQSFKFHHSYNIV